MVDGAPQIKSKLKSYSLRIVGWVSVHVAFLWELACLRWHRLGVPDLPSCLHRRQASSHILTPFGFTDMYTNPT